MENYTPETRCQYFWCVVNEDFLRDQTTRKSLRRKGQKGEPVCEVLTLETCVCARPERLLCQSGLWMNETPLCVILPPKTPPNLLERTLSQASSLVLVVWTQFLGSLCHFKQLSFFFTFFCSLKFYSPQFFFHFCFSLLLFFGISRCGGKQGATQCHQAVFYFAAFEKGAK